MPSPAQRELIRKLNTVVDAAVRDADEFGPTEERTAQVVDAVRVVLEVFKAVCAFRLKVLSAGWTRGQPVSAAIYLECCP